MKPISKNKKFEIVNGWIRFYDGEDGIQRRIKLETVDAYGFAWGCRKVILFLDGNSHLESHMTDFGGSDGERFMDELDKYFEDLKQ